MRDGVGASAEAVTALDTGLFGEPPAAAPAGRHRRVGASEIARLAGFLLVTLTLVTTYYSLPTAGVAQGVLISTVAMAVAVVVWLRVARTSGSTRVIWAFFATGIALSALANVPYYAFPLAGHVLPYPSPVDALWLGALPCYGVGLLLIAKQRHGGDNGGNMLDAMILFAGGATVMWEYMLYPALNSTGLDPFAHIVSALYPTTDLIL